MASKISSSAFLRFEDMDAFSMHGPHSCYLVVQLTLLFQVQAKCTTVYHNLYFCPIYCFMLKPLACIHVEWSASYICYVFSKKKSLCQLLPISKVTFPQIKTDLDYSAFKENWKEIIWTRSYLRETHIWFPK